MALIIAPFVTVDFTIPPEFDVVSHELHYKLQQGTSTGGMLHTGAIIWDGSKQLGRWIASGIGLCPPFDVTTPDVDSSDAVPSQTISHPLQGKRVLELGAGVTGIPSLVAISCGARLVTVTDLPSECELLRQNFLSNVCSVTTDKEGTESKAIEKCSCPFHAGIVSVEPFDWSNISKCCVDERHYDVVLAADIVYEQTWQDLANLSLALLRPGDGTTPAHL